MDMESLITVVPPTNALEWFPQEEDVFFVPHNFEVLEDIKTYLHSLSDGVCLPLRARDWESVATFTDWSNGVGIKNHTRIFFLYETGVIESFLIDGINYYDLVHFVVPRPNRRIDSEHQSTDPKKVVVLSHGWSFDLGPDYPLIRTLQSVATQLGWKVVVPDYRPSYDPDAADGRVSRQARVKILYEELLCLNPKPDIIVLVGHSQGGAVSSVACVDRVVENCNIKGLLLYGSECPIALDRMTWVPKVDHGLIVHAKGDKVISIGEMKETARLWNFKFKKLKSAVPGGERDCWGDDINHDFTAKELMYSAVQILEEFLQTCGNYNKNVENQ
jgi:hypothetical protein